MSASDAVILLVADGLVAAGRVLGRLRRRCDAEKRAQVCDADALTRAEESAEVLEPSDFPACTCPSRLAADVDDYWPACGARAGDSPAADELVSPAAGRTFGQAERDAYMAGLKWPEPKRVSVQMPDGTLRTEEFGSEPRMDAPVKRAHETIVSVCQQVDQLLGPEFVIEQVLREHDGTSVDMEQAFCLCGFELTDGVMTTREHHRIHVAEAISTRLKLAADKRIAERLDGAG